MNRCAVVIGVNKTGDLPVLQAAVTGAVEFSDWANNQGIDVALLTDSDSSSVTLSDIKKAVRGFVEKKTYSQLIVFFSGHGILKAPEYELWLLSGAPDDPNEAVNVPGSIQHARNSGIPHVVVVSDACRSMPSTSRINQIRGGEIFPNKSPRPPRPDVDVFYASLPGNPALEAAPKDAVNNYRGLFTECLLKGLSGDVPDVITAGETGTQWIIPSWKLKSYLEKQVPQSASDVNIKLQQDPDIRVESHPPKFLAEVTEPTFKVLDLSSRSLAPAALPKESIGSAVQSLKSDKYFQDSSKPTQGFPEITQRSNLKNAMDRLANAKGRESFETSTGFTVIGDQPIHALATNSQCDLFEENGAYHVRANPQSNQSPPQSMLIQLSNGSGIPLAILPGFIGTIIVEEGRTITVTYLPSKQSYKFGEYEPKAEELEKRRAYVAIAALNGSFRLDGNIEADEGAKYLRALKSIDPTLGLYASYAYAQAGKLNGIKSVYDYMHREEEPILFDVALLANRLPEPDLLSRDPHAVAPFCPMLTQGWALLGHNEKRLAPTIRVASRDLVPGLWTTFGPEATEILLSSIEAGELK